MHLAISAEGRTRIQHGMCAFPYGFNYSNIRVLAVHFEMARFTKIYGVKYLIAVKGFDPINGQPPNFRGGSLLPEIL